ncbi:putative membrane protein [Methanocella conradii HZ254]|uniref:Membrane protein n=1 Tax=Methanocella conradii (strain DSM 24694 / JCM 17849 / CGMCC 1.5162 / HZ254) TaxID=1041930 RepID=H8I6D3_METCZ|nr:MgtC/SapB family protein [Methanocella conradii]AFD01131.1 putative membrane protein [Methanocella conradii HZ254]MDI6897031.1 MgtC/SapB family protein [Methanocella conradii]
MVELTLYDFTFRIGLSTALGMFIGLEREWAHKEAGIRTFGLFCLTGMISTVIYQPYATIACAIFAIAFIIVMSAHGISQRKDPNLTTGAALFVTFFVGVLIGIGQMVPAVIIAIIVTALLSIKTELQSIAVELTAQEVHAAVEFGILAFVIYPILPDKPIDPWGVINPRTIWLMVVLISGIGFVNYIIMKKYGSKGAAYTGFFGGLANSTAIVAEFSSRIKAEPALTMIAVSAVILSDVAMCVRNLALCIFLAPSLLPKLIVPYGVMIVIGGLFAYRHIMKEQPVTVRIQSPFSIRNALVFGTIFLIMVILSAAAVFELGRAGFLISSFLSGMVSSASATASAIALLQSGTLDINTAAMGIILASMSSIIVKFPLAYVSNNKKFIARVALGGGIMMAAGILTAILII